MLSLAFTGALIALSFSAPPGPVAMETIRRGLRGGFYPALRVQLGSIIGDLTWCLLALLGLAPLVQVTWIRLGLAALGVGVLIYLGALGVRDALRATSAATAEAATPKQGAFQSGMMISLANPTAIGYWISVGSALIATGVAGSTTLENAWFIAGFLIATILWAFIMAGAVRWGSQLLNPTTFKVITLVCSAALIFFGLALANEIFQIFI